MPGKRYKNLGNGGTENSPLNFKKKDFDNAKMMDYNSNNPMDYNKPMSHGGPHVDVDEFGTPIPEGFTDDTRAYDFTIDGVRRKGEYSEEDAASEFFDDVRRADKAVSIIEDVQREGGRGLPYLGSSALRTLTGAGRSSDQRRAIENLRSQVDSDPREVLERINKNIDLNVRQGSDIATDVAKRIDPTGKFADRKSYYGDFYSRSEKQDPRFSGIQGRTAREKMRSFKNKN
jgi:hypothetical protein